MTDKNAAVLPKGPKLSLEKEVGMCSWTSHAFSHCCNVVIVGSHSSTTFGASKQTICPGHFHITYLIPYKINQSLKRWEHFFNRLKAGFVTVQSITSVNCQLSLQNWGCSQMKTIVCNTLLQALMWQSKASLSVILSTLPAIWADCLFVNLEPGCQFRTRL